MRRHTQLLHLCHLRPAAAPEPERGGARGTAQTPCLRSPGNGCASRQGRGSEEQLQNYSVHSFRIYAACALLAARAPRWLIKRMLRWRGDESLEIYARVNNEDWASWTRKMADVAVDSSIASRLTYMDFSEETRRRFTDVAEAMLSVNAGAARAATGAL